MTPRYSIIIPAYNEEYELPRTLRAFAIAMRDSGLPREQFEIIVVDNNSTDGTARIAAAWGAKVIFESKRQIARARNSGARAAHGEMLVSCDADSRPHPQIFRKLESEFARGVFAGGVRIWADPLKWSQYPLFLLVNFICLVERLPAGMYFLRREDFFTLGGFDESLYALEDVHFAKRIRREARRRRAPVSILWSYPILTSTRKFRRSRALDWFRMGILSMLRPIRYLTDRRYWRNLYYSSALRDSKSAS